MNAPIKTLQTLTKSNKEMALRAQNELLIDKDFSSLDRYWGDYYIQHNPNLANGLPALRVFKEAMVPQATTEILHALADGDKVFFIERVTGLLPVPVGFFDMYRMEDGKIVEHWDIFTPVEGPNPAGRTVFDGSFEITDLDQTEDNRQLVTRFAKRCLVLGDFSQIGTYVSENLVQHSAGMTDGADAFVSYFNYQQWFAQQIVYWDVRHVLAEGNFVLTASQGSVGGVAHALWDLWRVDDGLIVEHWSIKNEAKPSPLHTNPMI